MPDATDAPSVIARVVHSPLNRSLSPSVEGNTAVAWTTLDADRLEVGILLTTVPVEVTMDIVKRTETVKRTSKLVSVSERNLQTAAVRLLPKNNRLVSSEVDYLRRTLGDKATQEDIDTKVVLVRGLPWNEIVGDN